MFALWKRSLMSNQKDISSQQALLYICENINPNDYSLSLKLQVFVAKRDRQALISYKAKLHPQSEEYFYAENCLRVSVKIYSHTAFV
jgi:ABC-type uncharacterized transport system auxiliary subunit